MSMSRRPHRRADGSRHHWALMSTIVPNVWCWTCAWCASMTTKGLRTWQARVSPNVKGERVQLLYPRPSASKRFGVPGRDRTWDALALALIPVPTTRTESLSCPPRSSVSAVTTQAHNDNATVTANPLVPANACAAGSAGAAHNASAVTRGPATGHHEGPAPLRRRAFTGDSLATAVLGIR